MKVHVFPYFYIIANGNDDSLFANTEMPIHKFSSLRDYEIFFSKNPIPVFKVDSFGKISNCNTAACHMFGYSLDEFQKLTFDQITVPAYLQADRRNFQRLLDGEIDDYNMIKGYITKSGVSFIQHLYVFAVRDHENGIDHIVSMVLPPTGHTTRLWSIASKNLGFISKIIGWALVIALGIIVKLLFDIDITKIISP